MQAQIPLLSIQPSQLYIHAGKLAKVLHKFSKQQLEREKFPVIQMREKLVFTDQHTRAMAAYLYGIEMVRIYLDTDDISHEMYSECVRWCQQEEIMSVADLMDRVIDDAQYKRLWIQRCRTMHNEISSRQKT